MIIKSLGFPLMLLFYWMSSLIFAFLISLVSYIPIVYATERSKAVVLMLFLFCMALWFILRGASCSKIFPCSLSSCFSIPFSIVITVCGEEGAGLCVFRASVSLFCTC